MTTPDTPNASSPAPQRIEIFRAGTYTDMHGRTASFSAADLQQIADSYDPALHEAPVVIGHPTTNDPAYGWVSRVICDGDTLLVEETQVEPQFNKLRSEGRYKKRSASILPPGHPSNPKPEGYYLNHVGWLGGVKPAVDGLKDVKNFAAAGTLSFEFAVNDRRWGFGTAASMFAGLRDWVVDAFGLEKADQVIPRWQIDSLREAAGPDAADSPNYFAQSALPTQAATERNGAHMPNQPNQSANTPNTADFAARETALADRERVFSERERETRRTDAMSFADGLIQQGRLLPRDKSGVVALMLALPNQEPLAFADGDGKQQSKPAADLFRELLGGATPLLQFAEKSGGELPGNARTADFATPPGSEIDTERLRLHQQALEYQSKHPTVNYLAAVKACGG